MPSTIRLLDEQTINTIAAGEVIENTASVVKELTENAIDAKATAITIEIQAGGRQLIRITDNGCGMSPDDALLCLERHATSKLQAIDEIHSLLTMGFRGEAVPSIAAISKFMLLTSNSSEGTIVIVDGGKIQKCAPAKREQGTTVEVKALFFNVPVRKKFQRSPNYDTNEILKVITRLSLANPSISFQLISNENVLLTTKKNQTLAERTESVLGEEFFSHLFPINEKNIQGFLGFPYFHKQNRQEQYLFINNRAIISPLISYAIRDGYGTTLPNNRHPAYVLHLTLPTEHVDINVHPQKREVRFQEEYALKETLISAIDKALGHASPNPLPTEFTIKPPTASFSLPTISFPEITIEEEPSLPLFEAEKTQEPSFEIIAILERFILAKSPDGTTNLIDQKAAKARIIYEQLLDPTPPASQTLLIPETLDLTPEQSNNLRENLDLLNDQGFDIQELGQNSFAIHASPPIIPNYKDFILNTVDTRAIEKKQLALIAARQVRSKTLCQIEAAMLIKELMQCEHPYQSPLGEPTMVPVTQEDLHSLFSRKT